MTLHVYSAGVHKAMIVCQPKQADGYTPETPWLLLHNTGRIDRFAMQREAREEARKSWAGATFTRNNKEQP